MLLKVIKYYYSIHPCLHLFQIIFMTYIYLFLIYISIYDNHSLYLNSYSYSISFQQSCQIMSKESYNFSVSYFLSSYFITFPVTNLNFRFRLKFRTWNSLALHPKNNKSEIVMLVEVPLTLRRVNTTIMTYDLTI